MSYLVKAVKDKGFDMDVSCKSLTMSMQLPNRILEFSSENSNKEDIFSSMLSGMKGKSFQIKMTKYGKVVDVKNIENVFDSVFNILKAHSPTQSAQIKNQILKPYGEEAFKGSVE